MANEIIYTDAFIRAVLGNDWALTAALGGVKIYHGMAPQGTPTPYIRYDFLGGADPNTANQTRLMASLLYQIRAVFRVTQDTTFPTADDLTVINRLDELLSTIRRMPMVFSALSLHFNVWREQPIARDEPGETEEVYYTNYGGLYRVEAFS